MISKKAWLIIYSAIWSTLVARFSFDLAYSFLPVRAGSDIDHLPQIVPFFAFPIAIGLAFRLFKSKQIAPWTAIRFYAWGAPILLYLVLLGLVSLIVVYKALPLAPAAFLVGLVFGLPALVMGTVFHAVGILPLWFFIERIFDQQPREALPHPS